MKWQRIARLLIVLVAVACAVAVALTVRRRTPTRVEAPLARTDPKAMAESAGGQTIRWNREKEDVQIGYEKLLTYADGTSKMLGVTVKTDRSGRRFTITAREGQIGSRESIVELDGDVKVEANDGLILRTAHATYTESDGMARAPGQVQFSRGRMSGSGIGFTYDKNQDILSIVDEARVHVAADESGAGAMDVAAGAMEFRRDERTLRFERSMKATRARETLEADIAVAHLTADEQRLEAVELRGNSRIRALKPVPRGLQALTGQDIDLKYGADGQTLEHALINGNASIQLAGERRQPGRQITASVVEISLGADGTTVKGLTARENVRLNLPAEPNGVGRSIASQTLDGQGDDQRGLTAARFTGNVQFSERGPNIDRAARSAELEVAVGAGFSSIQDAKFARGVRFADGPLFATSALARYALDRGVLELSGSEPASLTPHIVNDQIAIDAVRVDVTLDGPIVKATGAVKSVMQPKKADTGASTTWSDVRMPSMLKQDQPVNVTADTLDYQGAASRATYAGNALLWQGDTQIKAPTIAIDSSKGDLTATGQVATVAVLLQEGKDGQKERVRSIATAATFGYDEATRRATYTGDAHMRGPQGDLTASRIELFLKPSGDELERVEGYDKLSLRAETRKTTGLRLTFFGDEGRYVVTGTPVSIVDECGRETIGRTLTFYKATDRIVVDGNEQVRTETKGKSNCPGT
jgi:lipopolysaccharide transport protein LptA/LPS export ABC transporter protein LptC